jgi:hypothetical protein
MKTLLQYRNMLGLGKEKLSGSASEGYPLAYFYAQNQKKEHGY